MTPIISLFIYYAHNFDYGEHASPELAIEYVRAGIRKSNARKEGDNSVVKITFTSP